MRWLTLALAAFGCTEAALSPPDASAPDAFIEGDAQVVDLGLDAEVLDAAAPQDVGTDTALDAGSDAGSTDGLDEGVDLAIDAAPDAAVPTQQVQGLVRPRLRPPVWATAWGFGEDGWTLLGQAPVGANQFSIEVPAYEGPVRVQLARTSDANAVPILTTLVADFDPARPIVVTPLGDLAWALGRAWAEDGDEVSATAEAYDHLGNHLGVRDLGFLHSSHDFDALDSVTLALGCVQAQATSTFGQVSGTTELALQLRVDASDGVIDGVEGELSAEALRTGLARTCTRWLDLEEQLDSEVNRRAVDFFASNTDERLFGSVPGPRPPWSTDDARLSARLVAADPDSRVVALDDNTVLARGSLAWEVDAWHGLALDPDDLTLSVGGEVQPGEILPTESPLHARQSLVIDGNDLVDGVEVEIAAQLRTDDGASLREVLWLAVDRHAPHVELRTPAEVRAFEHNEASIWATRHAGEPIEVRATGFDAYLASWWIELDGVRLAEGQGGPAFGVAVPLDLAALPEGDHTLSVEAVDLLDQRTTVRRVVRVDRTPPTIRLVPSRFLDHRGLSRLGRALRYRGFEGTIQASAQPIPFHRVHALGCLPSDCPELVFEVSDDLTPVGRLPVFAEHAPERVVGELGEDGLIHSGLSALMSALDEQTPAGTIWPPEHERTYVTEDEAGNRAQVILPALEVNFLANPPETYSPPQNPDFAWADVRSFLTEAGRLWLHDARLVGTESPNTRMTTPVIDARIRVHTQLNPGWAGQFMGLGSREGLTYRFEPNGSLRNETILEAPCLLGQDGRPRSDLEATYSLRAENRNGRMVDVVRAVECRPTRVPESLQYESPLPVRFESGEDNAPREGLWPVLPERAEMRVRMYTEFRSLVALANAAGQSILPDLLENQVHVIDNETVIHWHNPFCPDGVGCRPGWYLARRSIEIVRFEITVEETRYLTSLAVGAAQSSVLLAPAFSKAWSF